MRLHRRTRAEISAAIRQMATGAGQKGSGRVANRYADALRSKRWNIAAGNLLREI